MSVFPLQNKPSIETEAASSLKNKKKVFVSSSSLLFFSDIRLNRPLPLRQQPITPLLPPSLFLAGQSFTLFAGLEVESINIVNVKLMTTLLDDRTCINPLSRLRLVWFFFEPFLILIVICSFCSDQRLIFVGKSPATKSRTSRLSISPSISSTIYIHPPHSSSHWSPSLRIPSSSEDSTGQPLYL